MTIYSGCSRYLNIGTPNPPRLQTAFELNFHNYSPVNPYAPTFDDATSNAFKTTPQLQSRLRDAFIRMLKFYGFETNLTSTSAIAEATTQAQPSTITITPSKTHFASAARNWFNSHNDLRITRIIRCLRVAGLDQEAIVFYDALKRLFDEQEGYPIPIRSNSYMYWTRAAKRHIKIPPHMSDKDAERLLSSDK